jgi:hypothetical protein
VTTRQIQYLIAAVFFVLGGWCLVAPGSVLALSVRPEYQTDAPIAAIAVGCFGAQALIAGTFAAFSTFTRRTFLAYGIVVLPFFVFDYYFYAVRPVFNAVILLDAVGNVIFLALCVIGYRKAER